MKKNLFLCLMLACSGMGFAQDDYVPEAVDNYVPETLAADTVASVTSVDDIIKMNTDLDRTKHTDSHYSEVWGRNTFFNMSSINTSFESSNFPSAGGTKGTDGSYSSVDELHGKFKNQFGFGLQWGHTYNFHKKPIGDVLFIGLDYSWLDFNLNKYKEDEVKGYQWGKINMDGKDRYPLPWANEMFTFDYGMSVGPSLTLYPFTALGKKGTDEIRIQLYFHVGYAISMAFIKDVPDVDDSYYSYFGGSSSSSTKESDTTTEMALGHGLFTSFGVNLTWKFIGLGYEARHGSSYKYRSLATKFKLDDLKSEQMVNRFYLQFRF